MLKWFAFAVAALIGIVVILFAAVAWLVDPAEVAARIETQIESATGAEATLGAVDFALFPMPELHVAGFALDERSGRSIAAAEDVRIGVSLLSALFGRVVLSRVELRAPRVRLALDEQGRPVLPLAPGGGGGTGGGTPIAVRAIEIADGTLELGPWKLEHIFISGALGFDLTVDLEGRFELAGVGRVREQTLRISGLMDERPRVEAGGELVDFDLAALAQRLGRDEVGAGSLSGTYRLELDGDRLDSVQADLLARALQVARGGLRIDGDVPLRAQTGGRWTLDLAGALVEVEGALRKPPGGALALSGAVDPALGDLRLRVGESELPLRFAGGVLAAGPGTLDLAGVSSWLAAGVPLAGGIRVDSLEFRSSDLTLRGGGALESVEVPLSNGSLSLAGPWSVAKNQLNLPELEVKVAEQPFATSLVYDLATGRISTRVRAADAQLEPVLLATRGKAELTGALVLDARAEGPPDLQALSGEGSFELSDGELRGFSIGEQVLGELAKFPVLLAAAKGKDLRKYDEERFESIAAVFTLGKGLVHVQPLTARYRSGTATLRGTIRVSDGELDLRGRVELSREVDEELTGEPPKAPTVIPVEGVRGTIARPRLILDRAALASVASTLATRGKLGRQLDDTLGPGGAEAVQQIFEKLLRGGDSGESGK